MHDTPLEAAPGPECPDEVSVAPWWHTALIVSVLAGASLLGARSAHRGAGAEHHVARYSIGILMEWSLLLVTWFGLRIRRIRIAQLLRFRSGFESLMEDVGAAAVFWLLAVLVLTAIGALLRAVGLSAPQKTLMAMAPRTPLEVLLWLLLSCSAGFCEEFVFRGYLLCQFSSTGAGVWLGVLCSSVLFGISHGYEGAAGMIAITAYGAMFCVLVFVRRSLRPGMMAHAWHDIFSGVMLALGRHFHLL